MKKLFYFMAFMACLILLPVSLKASTMICSYVASEDATVIHIKYKGPGEEVVGLLDDNDGRTKILDYVSFKAGDFIDGNCNLICPNATIQVYEKNQGTYEKGYTISYSPNGLVAGKLTDKIEDGAEKAKCGGRESGADDYGTGGSGNTGAGSGSVKIDSDNKCVYNKGQDNEFKLSWSGKLVVDLTGSKFKKQNYCITEDSKNKFTKSDFDNGCPNEDSVSVAITNETTSGEHCKGMVTVKKMSGTTLSGESTGNPTGGSTVTGNGGNTNKSTGNGNGNTGNGGTYGDSYVGSIGTGYSSDNTMTIGEDDFCRKLSLVWTLVGYVIFSIKIIVPIILIITGMITLAQAVADGSEDKKKDAQKGLFKKVAYAVAVFLVIQIVSIIVGLVSAGKYEKCAYCSFHPFDKTNGCGIQKSDI